MYIYMYVYIYIYDISSLRVNDLKKYANKVFMKLDFVLKFSDSLNVESFRTSLCQGIRLSLNFLSVTGYNIGHNIK